MNQELQVKPQRKAVEAEAKEAEQRAFERSYKNARKEVAKAEGTAAGIAAATAPASALEAARQRAIGGVQKADTLAPQPKAPAPSGRIIQGADGKRYPEAYFDLSAEDQARYRELAAKQEAKAADDSAALESVNQLLDLRDRDSARVKALEAQLSTSVAVIESMQKRMDQMDLQVQADKSTALLEQEAGIAAAVTNLSAIRAEAGQEAAEHQAEREAAAAQHRAALEAMALAVDSLKGSVSSSTELMAERSNAVMDQLATAEGRTQKLDVRLQKLEGQADALGTPITRAEVQALITDAVSAEWRAQQDGITDAVAEQLQDEFPNGIHAPRVDKNRTRQLRSDAANYSDPVGGTR